VLRWIEEQCGETFPELWAELELGEMPEGLSSPVRKPASFFAKIGMVFQAIRDTPRRFRQARALMAWFEESRRQAERENTIQAWQSAVSAGEQVMRAFHPSLMRFGLDLIRSDLADRWNHLGTLLSDEGKYMDALAAYANAIRLQPDEAMYHRNRASVNIDSGNWEAAEADLKRAEELEPEHPRLVELRQWLEDKRQTAAELNSAAQEVEIG
jgi:tetratricopeptide (TPR) repeat protein